MKKFFAVLAIATVMIACNNGAESEKAAAGDTTKNEAADALKAADAASDTLKAGADTLAGKAKSLPDSLTN